MMNLPLPSRDSAKPDLEKALVTYRHKGEIKGYQASDAQIDQILALYDRYDADGAVASQALKGGQFPAALNQALKRAFNLTQEKRKLYSVRKALFQGVDLCPVCGIDTADELDHHLPRSVFFPLAIYSRNLIPLCHDCNDIKRAGFGDDEAGDAHFLHAYFDVLPEVEFIRASVEIVDGALEIEFVVVESAGLSEGFEERLTEQIRKLKLNERYKAEVQTYLAGHAVALHMRNAEAGAAGVARFLSLQARYETNAPFHRNHWRPVLLRALAAHAPFTEGGFAEVLPLDQAMLDELEALSAAE
jgi:hypothetical protein